ncbi:fatty acyl-CoA reductase 1 [Galendromus occidentalis]|uniref:Fatty acyl-CoA reductase n=1 Tax=Galendromus occidentalis TaxID=34638 RepID=A0AAJ6QTA0_9ACAR|nr:fatty acyl-CoA reductase 1 [Galendromus occidentalis]
MATIPEFFAGKNLLLTGVSGFLGKVLVEKLLRSCPEINSIFVLIREKKGLSGKDRLAKILSEKLFDHLHREKPECFSKVKLVPGDLLEDQIISNEDDEEMLLEQVNVVIHSAASVRFSEPLRNSVDVNLRATYKLLEFAKKMKNLVSAVHISTAYSNCQLRTVDETTYKCEVDPFQVMSLCEYMSTELVEELRAKLLKDRPNTYTFTKALTENLVEAYSNQIPIAIVRPSIITGAASEPLPGWVDNYNGPNGLLIALGTGALTTLYSHLDCTADLIPVDYVANTILAAASKQELGNFKIYNCTSGSQNPINWRMFMEKSVDIPLRYPSTTMVRYPRPRVTSYKWLHETRLFLEHYVPVRIIDFGLRCARRQSNAFRLYQRLSNSMYLLEFFATNEWNFINTNTQKLFESLHPSDKAEFNFDVRTIDWDSYVQTYCLGIRQYVLNDDLSNLEGGKSHLRRLKCVQYGANLALAWAAWKVCCAVLPCADLVGLC